MWSSLYPTGICNRTASPECIAQGHFSRVDLRTRETEGIRLMFKPACEHEEGLRIQVFVGSEHTAGTSEQQPPVVFQMELSTYCTFWYMCCVEERQVEAWRSAVRQCTHPLMFFSTEQWACLFLCVTSASLSYCKPAAVPGPGALSDSPQ